MNIHLCCFRRNLEPWTKIIEKQISAKHKEKFLHNYPFPKINNNCYDLLNPYFVLGIRVQFWHIM